MSAATDPPHGLRSNPVSTTATAPADLDVEREILGIILKDNDQLPRAQELLSPADFFSKKHQQIFAAMQELAKEGIGIDCTLINNRLGQNNSVDLMYLSDLIEGLPRNADITAYAATVRRKSADRKAMRVGQQIVEAASTSGDLLNPLSVLQEVVSYSAIETIPTGITSAAELLTMEVPEPAMLLDPIIREQDLVELYSWRGTGKTWFTLSQAIAVATGTSFLRWTVPEPQPVCFVDGEMTLFELKQRYAWLLRGATRGTDIQLEDMKLDFIARGHRLKSTFASDATRTRFLRTVRDEGYKFVVFDNISSLMQTDSENDASAWNKYADFENELRHMGVSVEHVHHAGKTQKSRGTSRRQDPLHLVINLKHPKDYQPEDGCRFEIHFEKTRSLKGMDAASLEARLKIGKVEGELEATWETVELSKTKKALGIKLLNDGMSAKDVASELGVHPKTPYKWLDEARKDGDL
jgi:putative DNA primase/helicase